MRNTQLRDTVTSLVNSSVANAGQGFTQGLVEADAALAADSVAGSRYIADNIKQWTDSAINGRRNGAD